MRRVLIAAVAVAGLAGCGGPAPVHPVSGKVTLGGKPYERLLVYFRPVDGNVNESTLGVGETDKNGNLTLRSTTGNGLAVGEYRVTFSCVVSKAGKVVSGIGEKPDDAGPAATIELVPPPYDARTSGESSPVLFTVKSGENRFEFDIPARKK